MITMTKRHCITRSDAASMLEIRPEVFDRLNNDGRIKFERCRFNGCQRGYYEDEVIGFCKVNRVARFQGRYGIVPKTRKNLKLF